MAAGRGLSEEAAGAVAEGRVWTGDQAVQNGLVDGLGGLVRSLRAVKGLLGLQPTDRVALISYERRLTLLERLLVQSMRRAEIATEPLPPALVDQLFPTGRIASDTCKVVYYFRTSPDRRRRPTTP